MDGHFLFECLGFILTLVLAIWGYEKYNQKRIAVIWEKIDKQRQFNEEEFLRKDIYDIEKGHAKELSEQRNLHVMEFFKDKFESLEREFKELKLAVKENNHHTGRQT